MLKVIIRKKIELVEKVANIDAAKGIHLGEGQNARKSRIARAPLEVSIGRLMQHLRHFFERLGLYEPANINNLFVFLSRIDRHGHIVVGRHNLFRIHT